MLPWFSKLHQLLFHSPSCHPLTCFFLFCFFSSGCFYSFICFPYWSVIIVYMYVCTIPLPKCTKLPNKKKFTKKEFPQKNSSFNISLMVHRLKIGWMVLLYSFSRLLWHIFPFTVYFFKAAHTQPLTEAEMTKTLYDVCRMTPPSQNLSHTHQNQTFPSKPTICAQLKMYVFSFI